MSNNNRIYGLKEYCKAFTDVEPLLEKGRQMLLEADMKERDDKIWNYLEKDQRKIMVDDSRGLKSEIVYFEDSLFYPRDLGDIRNKRIYNPELIEALYSEKK